MSTSLIYHALGLKDQHYIKTEYKSGSIIFHVKTKASKLRCSVCGSPDVIKKGAIPRIFRSVNVGMKPIFIKIALQRLYCNSCGVLRQEKIKFADKKTIYSCI
ncbi:MAG: transposase family protein [Fidelibacterota bacterium]